MMDDHDDGCCADNDKSNDEALQELGKCLCCKELTFTQLSDGREDTALTVSIKKDKYAEKKQFRLHLGFQEHRILELDDRSKSIEDRLISILCQFDEQPIALKFAFIDERLPSLINRVLQVFVLKSQQIKKLVFECCGSQSSEEKSIFDAQTLLQSCRLAQEFHLDYEDLGIDTHFDLPLILQVLQQTLTLKVLTLSCTYCGDMKQLARVVQNNPELKEVGLYNAFAQVTKEALCPLVDSLKVHPYLQKFTFLHALLQSSVYKWAITSIVEGNKNVTGLCTDGYYNQNATWLARFLGTNDQLKEVNLSHPSYEDGHDRYDRMSTSGATLSLLQGIKRSSTLKSVKLLGIPLEESHAMTIRILLEKDATALEKLECGNNFMSTIHFSTIIGGLISNSTLKQFTIKSLDLDLIGARTIAEVLSNNTTLMSLNLGANRRRYRLRRRLNRQPDPSVVDPSELARIIAAGLGRNTTLKSLSLPIIMRNQECLTPFANLLKQDNTTLERLSFWHKIRCSEEIEYYTMLNRCGRQSLLKATTPQSLFANVFAKANNLDCIRYFVTEAPTLFAPIHRDLKRPATSEAEHDTSVGRKRIKISST